MSNLNEVQPIDRYVQSILQNAKEKYGLKINLTNPTRGQRLEAALAMQNECDGFNSMEIMVGRRVDSSDKLAQMFITLKLAQALSKPSDQRKFYEGFVHQYSPDRNQRD